MFPEKKFYQQFSEAAWKPPGLRQEVVYEVDQMDAVSKVGVQEVSSVERHEGCLDPDLSGSSLSSDYITALSTRRRLINVSQLSNKYH